MTYINPLDPPENPLRGWLPDWVDDDDDEDEDEDELWEQYMRWAGR